MTQNEKFRHHKNRKKFIKIKKASFFFYNPSKLSKSGKKKKTDKYASAKVKNPESEL